MTITAESFRRAAAALGCEVPEIRAVCEVEAPRGGFLPSGAPTILFERHVFSRLTGRRYDKTHGGVSNPMPGGYQGGEAEHARLAYAVGLDRAAALQSASWGKFQIMGFNHAAAGYPTLQGFVNAMYESEDRQLDAFVAFLLSNPSMVRALRRQDWADFARRYNGPAFRGNQYDTKLAAAYKRFAAALA